MSETADLFSGRIPPHRHPNALSMAIDRLRSAATPLVDLTESNPTRVGLPYPADLLSALAAPRSLRYEPEPLGALTARAAIAADIARRGTAVDPEHIVLCASTSEAYSWLFKLLCNPGDTILVPRPSYPLFDHLARLEAVQPEPYDLEYHGRWSIDFDRVLRAPARTRALLVVSPNNPTGSYVSAAELDRLASICADRGWALVADEVFADYPLDAGDALTDLASRVDVLSATLAGASKTVGLPQVKLGWMAIGGAAPVRDAALAALAVVADTFLSVGTPVQVAASDLLERGAAVRAAIHARIRGNLNRAREIAIAHPACEVLRVEGGWSAVVRVPATDGEERLVLDLLQQERVLVHPGYFFDFAREAYVIVSLLPEPDVFAAGFERLLCFASR